MCARATDQSDGGPSRVSAGIGRFGDGMLASDIGVSNVSLLSSEGEMGDN